MPWLKISMNYSLEPILGSIMKVLGKWEHYSDFQMRLPCWLLDMLWPRILLIDQTNNVLITHTFIQFSVPTILLPIMMTTSTVKLPPAILTHWWIFSKYFVREHIYWGVDFCQLVLGRPWLLSLSKSSQVRSLSRTISELRKRRDSIVSSSVRWSVHPSVTLF